jgi:hypothetical protein
MQIPPDTSNGYMALGYAVVILMLFGLTAYMVNRSRRLNQELALLASLDEDSPAQKDHI